MRGEDQRNGAGSEGAVTDVQQAAVEATDPGRLLDGEDPETLQLHDAEHWIRVYGDLLQFKRALLSSAQAMVPKMAEEARDEVGKTDLLIMDAEAAKLARRLEFWRHRRAELGGE